MSQTTSGSGLEDAPYDQIVPKKTRRADVTRLLGPPDEIIHANKEHDPLYERVYIYKRTKARQTALFLVIFSTHRSDTKYDTIAVFFNEAGVVQHIGTRLDAKDASYGMPW